MSQVGLLLLFTGSNLIYGGFEYELKYLKTIRWLKGLIGWSMKFFGLDRYAISKSNWSSSTKPQFKRLEKDWSISSANPVQFFKFPKILQPVK